MAGPSRNVSASRKSRNPYTTGSPISRRNTKETHHNIAVENDSDDEAAADEEDNSTDNTVEDEDEDEQTDTDAPSSGARTLSESGPTIEIDATWIDTDAPVSTRSPYRGAGLTNQLDPSQILSPSKKRSFSNTSSHSTLRGDESDTSQTLAGSYPRKKIQRRLSNTMTGLLAYDDFEQQNQALFGQSQPLFDDTNSTSSGDEGYNRVDLVSDEDEDAEIEDEKSLLPEIFASLDDEELQLLVGDIGQRGTIFPEDPFIDAESFPTVYRTASPSDTEQQPATSRRVRFSIDVDSYHSSSESEFGEKEILDTYGDIFTPRDSLPPALQSLIENDETAHTRHPSPADSQSSYWDFHDDNPFPDGEGSTDEESSAGSSGYETDEGETTEEDLPEVARICNPMALAKSQTPPRTSPKQQSAKKSPSQRPRGPVRGIWTIEEDKAVGTMGSNCMLIMYPPRKGAFWSQQPSTSSNSVNPSPRQSAASLAGEESDATEVSAAYRTVDPILSTPIAGTNTGDFSRFLMGPPETFFANTALDADGNMYYYDDPTEDDDDEFSGDDFDLAAFLELGEEDNNEDLEDEDTPGETTASEFDFATTDISSTPVRPSSSASQGFDMMEHYDRVHRSLGAFRGNMARHQRVAALPQNPAMRAAQSDRNAVQNGRASAAKVPITPIRKQRGGAHSSLRRGSFSRNSPLEKQSMRRPMAPPQRRGKSS